MSFTIPNYVSGTPQNYTSFSGFNQNNVPAFLLDRLNNSFGGGAGLTNQFNSNMSSLNQNFNNASAKLPAMYKAQLTPALQNTLNIMARRGIIPSSVTGEALGTAATNVGNNILGMQSGIDQNRAQSLAGSQQGFLGNLASLYNNQSGNISSLVNNLGRTSYSQDPLASQKLFLNSIQQFGGF